MNKRRQRPQASKPRNEAFSKGMQELRRSNAAGFHKAGNEYRRKGKYGNNWNNEEN